MEKTEDAFRTISEAAEELDLPQHVLRFWETRFPQIRPLKRGGGRRYYRPDDVELLRAIRHLLYSEGYTIKGVQRMLKERGVRAVLAMRSEASEGRPVNDAPSRGAEAPIALSPDDSPPMTPLRDPAPILAPGPEDAEAGYEMAAHITAHPPAERAQTAFAPAPSAPQRPAAPAWTPEQKRKLDAAIAELAECRRILGAANI